MVAERRQRRERPRRILRSVLASVFAATAAMGAAEWAARHGRSIPPRSREAIPYDPDLTPYASGILDAATQWTIHGDRISQISIMAPEQVSKTETLLQLLAWMIANRPGETLIVYPNKQVARDHNTKRITPMIEKNPQLAAHMTGRARDTKSLAIVLDTMDIKLAGAPPHRPPDANLESFARTLVVVDELDRCHSEIVTIVSGRGKTVEEFLLVVSGTPGMKNVGIDEQYFGSEATRGSDQRQYWVPCPHEECRRYHVREWKQVRWPGLKRGSRGAGLRTESVPSDDTRDPHADPEVVKHHAWFKCPDCRQRIGAEHNLWQMKRGVWLNRNQTIGKWERGPEAGHDRNSEKNFRAGEVTGQITSTHAGFALNGLMSCMPAGINPYGYVANGYVDAKGKPSPQWWNRRLGVAWQPKGDSVEVSELRALGEKTANGGYRLGTLPDWAQILVAAVDVQQASAYIEIMGFSEGATDVGLIDCGQVLWPEKTDGTELARFLDRFYLGRDGRKRRSCWECLDEGDRTEEVHNFLRRRRAGAFGTGKRWADSIKGVGLGGGAESLAGPFSITYIDKLADGKTPDERGPRRIRINSFYWKTAAMTRMRPPGGSQRGDEPNDEAPEDGPTGTPGGLIMLATSRLHLPEDVPEEYLSQVTAEQRVVLPSRGWGSRPKVMYQLRPGRTANHYFDCHVYGMALAEAIGVRNLRIAPAAVKPAASPAAQARPAPARPTPAMAAMAAMAERAKEQQRRMSGRLGTGNGEEDLSIGG